MRALVRKPKNTQPAASAKAALYGRGQLRQESEANSILSSKRTIGNQAVQGLLRDNTGGLKGDSTFTELAPAGHDFSRIPVYADTGRPPQPKLESKATGETREEQVRRAPGPWARRSFSEAANGSPSSLPYREAMEFSFREDFSGIKAYLGRGESMDRLNAHAATSGEQVVFGVSSPDKRLVAHELTHVVQQRRGGAQCSGQLSVSGDAAEREADRVAERAAAGEQVKVSAAVGPAIYRDIKDKNLNVPLGHFEIDMTKSEVKGGMTGEEGNVSFTPNDKAPDAKSIRLSQAAKTFDVDKKADFTFQQKVTLNKIRTTSGDGTHTTIKGETLNKIAQQHYGESSRFADIFNANKAALDPTMKTAEGDTSLPANLTLTIPQAVAGGFFIDHLPTDPKAKVRTAKKDPVVPQDYVWPGEEVKGKNQHGSKAGKRIVPAILDDKPKAQGTQHLQYTFETVARSDDAGVHYGTIHWSFEADGPAGKVTNEAHRVAPGVSDTYRAALGEFNKFYKNPPIGP